jgi:hypothetical protein
MLLCDYQALLRQGVVSRGMRADQRGQWACGLRLVAAEDALEVRVWAEPGGRAWASLPGWGERDRVAAALVRVSKLLEDPHLRYEPAGRASR